MKTTVQSERCTVSHQQRTLPRILLTVAAPKPQAVLAKDLQGIFFCVQQLAAWTSTSTKKQEHTGTPPTKTLEASNQNMQFHKVSHLYVHNYSKMMRWMCIYGDVLEHVQKMLWHQALGFPDLPQPQRGLS